MAVSGKDLVEMIAKINSSKQLIREAERDIRSTEMDLKLALIDRRLTDALTINYRILERILQYDMMHNLKQFNDERM